MNHYSGFDPYVIKERNEQIRREVRALRLEERVRDHHRQTPAEPPDMERLMAIAARYDIDILGPLPGN